MIPLLERSDINFELCHNDGKTAIKINRIDRDKVTEVIGLPLNSKIPHIPKL